MLETYRNTQVKKSRKDCVYNAIRNMIISGELSSGTSLVEYELSEHYNISRTPIREILHRLWHEGLVDIYPNKGAFVKILTSKDLVNIYQAREAVEGTSTRIASQSIDKTVWELLEQEFAKLDIEKSPASECVKLGQKLHDAIIHSTDNSLLHKLYVSLSAQAALVRNLSQTNINLEKHSYTEHLEIIDRLKKSDLNGSEAAMREHLRQSCERTLRALSY